MLYFQNNYIMFCRNCGKQIEDDSKFCKYCGTQLCIESAERPNKDGQSLYMKFTSLAPVWQILILIYGLWVLGWIGVLIGCADTSDFDDAVILAFISVLIIPFVFISIVHIVRLVKSKQHKVDVVTDTVTNLEKTGEQVVAKEKNLFEIQPPVYDFEVNYGKEVERFALKEFSLLYGKMQVKTVKLRDGTVQSYCTFANGGIETKVEFDKKIGVLSASEISARKEELCVLEYENRLFVLTEKK